MKSKFGKFAIDACGCTVRREAGVRRGRSGRGAVYANGARRWPCTALCWRLFSLSHLLLVLWKRDTMGKSLSALHLLCKAFFSRYLWNVTFCRQAFMFQQKKKTRIEWKHVKNMCYSRISIFFQTMKFSNLLDLSWDSHSYEMSNLNKSWKNK